MDITSPKKIIVETLDNGGVEITSPDQIKVSGSFEQGIDITVPSVKDISIQSSVDSEVAVKTFAQDKIILVEPESKGEKGDKGGKGDRGPKGDKGEKGETGRQGIQGPNGDKGQKGDAGDKGEKGDTGKEGKIGPVGPVGPAGIKGDIGPAGPKGDKGDQGPQGLKGDTGEKGEQGDRGFHGPSGPPGLNGAPGPAGADGAVGPAGPAGAPGVGVPPAGTTGQVLAKQSNTDYDTVWVPAGAGGAVISDGVTIDGDGTLADPLSVIPAGLTTKMDIDGENSDITYLDFNITPGVIAHQEGRLHWDDDDGTLEIDMPGGNVKLQIGQETLIRVKNTSGALITNGSVVYISGSTGDRPEVSLAINSDQTKTFVLGLATEDIATGHFGYIVMHGLCRDVPTGGMTEGFPVWLSDVAGGYTQTRPSAPAINVFLGYVIRAHNTEGVIAVRPVVVPRMNGLSDVNGPALSTTGQFPVWDDTNKYFDFNHNIEDYPTLAVHTAMQDPTGIENRAHSTLSFAVVANKAVVTIIPNAPGYTEYNIWFDGVKHTISESKDITLPDTEGVHAVYFDTDDTLKSVLNPGYAEMLIAIKDKCLVAIVYWDADNKEIVYDGEERHGCVMDGMTHYYLHYTKGLAWIEGNALGDFSIGNGSSDSHAQFSVATGLVSDEDIGLATDAIGSTDGIPILYRSGADGYWRRLSQPGFACYRGANTRLSWNEWTGATWQLSQVTNNDFVLYHIFVTTGYDDAIFSIMGQGDYATLPAARAGANTEISNLLLGTLPTPEIRPIGTVIFQTGNYGNTVNAKVVLTDDGENYIDWRTNDLPRGSAPADHGNLTGLSDDDHTQYSLVNGTRAFTGEVAGIDPTVDASLATKRYVDNVIAGFEVDGGFANSVYLAIQKADGGGA